MPRKDTDGALDPSLIAAFGATIRERREQLGMTQAELARRAGLARNTVRAVEGGESNLSLDVIDRVARPLGMNPSLLLRKAELRTSQWAKRFWRRSADSPLI